jgi:hypothetical protein
MAYAQGDVIEATDYNNLINGTNQLNTVWGVGVGDAGYGQTAISAVTAGFEATATQWATLINTLNSARVHQTGSGSGISAVSAGATINHLSTLVTSINSAYSDRTSYASQGATITGGTQSRFVNSTAGLGTWQVFDTAATFASADQARYFFNTGGQLNLVLGTNGNNGTGSSNSLTRLITGLGGVRLFQTTNSGRTGTGIQLDTNITSIGYYDLTQSPQTIIQVTDNTASYTGSNGVIQLYTQDGTGTNGAKGFQIVFRLLYDVDDKIWDDTISLNITTRVDLVQPETVNLTNSWGSPRSGYFDNIVFSNLNKGQGGGNNCTLIADGGTAGPYNNSTPLRMTQTGADTHTSTLFNFAYNVAQAAVGQVWRLTYWVRASASIVIEGAWVAEANGGGGYLGGATYVSGQVNGSIPVNTTWQRISTTWEITNSATAFAQIRLDGTQTYTGSPSNVWWDLVNLERVS